MIEEPKLLDIPLNELRPRVEAMKKDGYRLVQINCTKLPEQFEVNYSFDKGYAFINLRVTLPLVNDGLLSVSPVYMSAFLYENEIHDLFGINVREMVLDYKGNFYRLAQKAPFATPPPAPEKKEV